MTTVLLTGIVGGLARRVALELLAQGHEVIGVDYRAARTPPPEGVIFYRANYNKTRIEDIVRRHKPRRVLHLGRVGNLKMTPNKRFDLNVVGSAKIMELCHKHKVATLVVLSTFHIYGAHPHNHIPIYEDEPLRAGQDFPQLADAVQLDNQACTWVYRHRKLRTVVLRPVNVIGPNIRNAISTYLRQRVLSYLLGFSPMWQFVHEDDMARAVHLAAECDSYGVFNVAGGDAVPLIHALKLTGARLLPVPPLLADAALRFGNRVLGSFPPYLLDFFKYPVVVSDRHFRERCGYSPRLSVEEAIASCVTGDRRHPGGGRDRDQSSASADSR